VLHRGRLIGRVDAKAHRALGAFELKSVHVEPRVRIGTGLATDVAKAIRKLATWHGTPEVTVAHAPPELVDALRGA
jgi:uncharacterized protein YcaQ